MLKTFFGYVQAKAFILLTAVLSAAFLSSLVTGCAPTGNMTQQTAPDAVVSETTYTEEQAGVDTEGAIPPVVSEKQITGIRIEETPGEWVVVVTANHTADYTLAESPLEHEAVLYFAEALLGVSQSEYPSDSDIIGTVSAVDLIKNGPCKIVIPILQPDVQYDTRRGSDPNTVEVVFHKKSTGYADVAETAADAATNFEPGIEVGDMNAYDDSGMPAVDDSASETSDVDTSIYAWEASADETPADVPVAPSVATEVAMPPPSPATMVQDVQVVADGSGVAVKLIADGIIEGYRNFTLTGPARIVFDLPDIKSKYSKEKRIAVDSGRVSRVRYCAHPDFLRVVLDVDKASLSDFEGVSLRDGMMILVGDASAVAGDIRPYESSAAAAVASATEPVAEDVAPVDVTPVIDESDVTSEDVSGAVAAGQGDKTVDASAYGQAAWINKIDFITGAAGRSSLEIGTTHPVNYDLVSVGDKKLKLTLQDANIKPFRKRPLITTRFESAVDLIMPIQTDKMQAEQISVFDITLRENVGYSSERDGNLIKVSFEPSSVPADPAREVVIPTEYRVTGESSGIMTEVTDMADVVVPDAEEATGLDEQAVTDAGTIPDDEVAEGLGLTDELADESATDDDLAGSETAMLEDDSYETPSILLKKKRYTGEPIALDFFKTDIRNVIRILKDVSGKNFAIDEDVSGSVTLSFINPVPWDQVLDLILEMNGLGQIERNGIIRIATRSTIRQQKEEAQAELAAQQELEKTEESLAPLETEYFAVSYAEAGSDILPHIQPLLTDRGHAKVDSRTNQVIMTDVAERIEKAREVIERIDRVTPQVMIKARIVETSSSFAREFGTTWGFTNNGGKHSDRLGGDYNYGVAMNNLAGSNFLDLTFQRLTTHGTPFTLDAVLGLMESNGQVKIISTPKIMTLDNKTATISQGQEIPYTTVDDGEADTQFKDADLELKVKPHVTPDNRISMAIDIIEKEVGETGAGDEPPLNTKEAHTELLVNDGDTVVIGGILQETTTKGSSGLPWLNRIPILGPLFGKRTADDNKTELLIFITPTIVRLD